MDQSISFGEERAFILLNKREETRMQGLFGNLRYGARQLLRAPTFTIVTILTLALGVGCKHGDLQCRAGDPFAPGWGG